MSDDEKNVVRFPGTKTLDDGQEVTHGVLDPDEMLTAITEEVDLKEAVVLGWTQDEELFIATSHPSTPEVVFLLELAKAMFLNKSLYG